MLSKRSLAVLFTALCASLVSAAPAPSGQPSASPSAAPVPTSNGPSTPPASTPAAPSSQPSGQPQQPSPSGAPASGSSGYWYADISHAQDTVWMNNDTSYQVFRNVITDYGAAGDGETDDTAAINLAMSDGGRCGGLPNFTACASTTITPAVVYFPPGTYLISSPILMFYYTQMVGDPLNPPTIVTSSDFAGIAAIDADPYIPNGSGANWYLDTDNFFRQVRNFVIDIRQFGAGLAGAGIHWQVAQATSLQNIVFEMSDDPATKQQGIFMDNGSGGWFSDLVFNNGGIGAFLGNQQFTTRNLTFNNCQTAIFMNWNWGWTFHGVTVNGGQVGLNMANQPTNQTVGSVVLADSTFKDVEYGVKFAYQNTSSNVYPTGGTLILDNVDMSGVTSAAIIDNNNATILAPGMIDAWASGNGYDNPARRGTQTVLMPTKQENAIAGARKIPSLLDSTGAIYGQSRPQYESYPVSSFVSAMSNNCTGDGTTDDTAAIQALLQKVAGTQNIAYFEHGAYLVKDTITVPANVMMTGEVWPLIVADSASFSDESNPKPVFQVGRSGGEAGFFQISDFIFETNGPAPGAVMIEWNLDSQQGDSGMWDTHVRIGGSAGTNLEWAECGAVNGTSAPINRQCEGVFLMFHATTPASGVYLENTWFWVADHTLDVDAPKQVSLYSGRGMLIQAKGPTWLWGTAAEHSLIYNYQFDGVQALYSGLMQSETPYMQPYPQAPTPLSFSRSYGDPEFGICNHTTSTTMSQYCREAWGLRIVDSKNVLIYTTGLYSFFQDYQQTCTTTRDCQLNMIHLENSQVDMYAVNTFAAVNMIMEDGVGVVRNEDNMNWFTGTVSYYFTGE